MYLTKIHSDVPLAWAPFTHIAFFILHLRVKSNLIVNWPVNMIFQDRTARYEIFHARARAVPNDKIGSVHFLNASIAITRGVDVSLALDFCVKWAFSGRSNGDFIILLMSAELNI